jgi:hypothetical protein
MCMLLNVAAHNLSIRNIKMTKRERHITYSVTYIQHTYVLELLRCVQLRFVTLRHATFTLCCFTLCSNIRQTFKVFLLFYISLMERNLKLCVFKSITISFKATGSLNTGIPPPSPHSVHHTFVPCQLDGCVNRREVLT